MVLEAMVTPGKAEKNPLFIILLGFLFVTVSVWLSMNVLDIEPKSMIMIMFVVIPALPFTLSLFQEDEEILEHEKVLGSRTLAKHFSTLIVLLALFLGLIIGFAFWYLALPAPEAEKLFSQQISELKGIKAIGGTLGGRVIALVERSTGLAVSTSFAPTFEFIFMHNLWVLFLIIAFSVVYGAGSIFVIVWNASVVGVFLGNFAQQYVLHSTAYNLAGGVGLGILGLLPHGTFELMSYSVGALAGGVLSTALVKGNFSYRFMEILRDIAKMIAWAVVLLAIGALIESKAIIF
ncbi:MAG: stage II sporulation protein M [Candidatus Micrarchaeota archaeon]